MFIRTTIRRAAMFAALPMLLAAMPADDVRPTDAEERFRSKYGQYPPYVQQKQRAQLEAQRKRVAEEKKRTEQAQKSSPVVDDQRSVDSERQPARSENDRH